MKYDWKKEEKMFYGAKMKLEVVEVPCFNYILLSGHGDPNEPLFSQKVSTLFSLAYAIKMNYKKQSHDNETISDYAVYPLEGLWSLSSKQERLNKDELEYTIMIRQPDFITEEMVDQAIEKIKKKKDDPFIDDVVFEAICDGECVQILHKGSFDDEPASFEKLDQYCQDHGYKRIKNQHREIYLNDKNRTKTENLKTILRYPISKS
ncbi:GyrI-like domain-containing protein [Dubosiella newyorkensis]|uniref:GyrI-like domain-containing protein n=1 Tax=Dubosiella newyorkensis TaxID=1862672 RepID=UPI00248B7E29|nr:GyrI-like domain-containing protein [Dubosiella newyorkensis]